MLRYLCGSGAHPGGSGTGAPALNAAREIVRDCKRRLVQAAVFSFSACDSVISQFHDCHQVPTHASTSQGLAPR